MFVVLSFAISVLTSIAFSFAAPHVLLFAKMYFADIVAMALMMCSIALFMIRSFLYLENKENIERLQLFCFEIEDHSALNAFSRVLSLASLSVAFLYGEHVLGLVFFWWIAVQIMRLDFSLQKNLDISLSDFLQIMGMMAKEEVGGRIKKLFA